MQIQNRQHQRFSCQYFETLHRETAQYYWYLCNSLPTFLSNTSYSTLFLLPQYRPVCVSSDVYGLRKLHDSQYGQLNDKKQRQQTLLNHSWTLFAARSKSIKCLWSAATIPCLNTPIFHFKEQVFEWKTLTEALVYLHVELNSLENIFFLSDYKWNTPVQNYATLSLVGYLDEQGYDVWHQILPSHYYYCKRNRS